MTDPAENFLISGMGDNTLLICAWSQEGSPACEWTLPFPTAEPVIRILQELDNHAITNHGYVRPARVEGYLPPGTTIYESEADYKARRYDPVEERWLRYNEDDYEPTTPVPTKEPNNDPHQFVPRPTFGAPSPHCEECWPERRRQAHTIHRERE